MRSSLYFQTSASAVRRQPHAGGISAWRGGGRAPLAISRRRLHWAAFRYGVSSPKPQPLEGAMHHDEVCVEGLDVWWRLAEEDSINAVPIDEDLM